MGCVVITRGGAGAVWEVSSREAARLCPLFQYWDVYVESATELLQSRGRLDAYQLAQLASDEREREAVRPALEEWSRRDGSRQRRAAEDAAERLFAHLRSIARPPPSDPAELVRVATEDRRAMEGVALTPRHIGETRDSERNHDMTETAAETATEKKTRAARISKDSVIHFGKDAEGNVFSTDNNPRKKGTASHGLFALYKDGMTVAEAEAAGLRPVDIRWDLNKGHIRVDAPAPKTVE